MKERKREGGKDYNPKKKDLISYLANLVQLIGKGICDTSHPELSEPSTEFGLFVWFGRTWEDFGWEDVVRDGGWWGWGAGFFLFG